MTTHTKEKRERQRKLLKKFYSGAWELPNLRSYKEVYHCWGRRVAGGDLHHLAGHPRKWWALPYSRSSECSMIKTKTKSITA